MKVKRLLAYISIVITIVSFFNLHVFEDLVNAWGMLFVFAWLHVFAIIVYWVSDNWNKELW
jgi:hypothetical protein